MPPNKRSVMDSNTKGDKSVPSQEMAVDANPPDKLMSTGYHAGCRVSSTASILGGACSFLASAEEHLIDREKALKIFCTTHGHPSLADRARLHNVGKLSKAIGRMSAVIELLSKSLVRAGEQGTRREKVFTPVLVNTITRESAEIERISRHLPTGEEEILILETGINAIRQAAVRCVDAFEPVRRAVFHPNGRIENQTREYLRSLDIDWGGLFIVKEALPAKSQFPLIASRGLEQSSGKSIVSETRRYWPV